MYTLIIVDMQAAFRAANNSNVQKHCKKAIEKAIKNKAGIVFLEYVGQGPTLPKLTNLTTGYKRVYNVTKSDWDGSKEAIACAKKHNLSTKKIRLCGVYTDCCVKATLKGLCYAIENIKLELLHKACGASYLEGQTNTIEVVKKMKHVRIVEA